MPKLVVDYEDRRLRLDQYLAQQVPEHSRARWQQLIKSGHVTIDGTPRKPNYNVQAHETVDFIVPAPEPSHELEHLESEDLPLEIIHEDEDIIVLNKAAGMVVHPAPGNWTGTLVNALLFHCDDLQGIGGQERPGIVHRLDKDTSGLMVAAKNEQAMNHLQAQFKNRTVKKSYHALIWGKPNPLHEKIVTTIGRSTGDRKKMGVNMPNGKNAVTIYTCLEIFANTTLVNCHIETGRTHQIRVHMAWKRCPIVGDTVYGRRRTTPLPAPAPRQMLHAHELGFRHPSNGEEMAFTSDPPADMAALLTGLRA